MSPLHGPVEHELVSVRKDCALNTDLLILPDGRVLAHNLTPALAELLRELNPDDPQIQPRSVRRPGETDCRSSD